MSQAMPLIDEPAAAATASPEISLERELRNLMTSLHQQASGRERRHDQRFAYPHLLYVQPLTNNGLEPDGEPLVVVGKHISQKGLGFFHPFPLPYRRVAVSLDRPDRSRVTFVLDLNWCRFTHVGWYESGGRFLSVCLPDDSAD